MRENECSKLDSPRPMDLSAEIVMLLEKLMLTQAQVWGWGWGKGGGQENRRDEVEGRGRGTEYKSP